MLRRELTHLVETARDRLVASGRLPEAVRQIAIDVSDTKTPEHGDYACNFALVATKPAGVPPRQIGEMLRDELIGETAMFESIDLAGPGFLNMRLKPEAISRYVPEVVETGSAFGRTDIGKGEAVNVEFVSVNPNGPITIGSGRGAAFGDAISRVLEAAGYQAHREYYINDGVNS